MPARPCPSPRLGLREECIGELKLEFSDEAPQEVTIIILLLTTKGADVLRRIGACPRIHIREHHNNGIGVSTHEHAKNTPILIEEMWRLRSSIDWCMHYANDQLRPSYVQHRQQEARRVRYVCVPRLAP